MSSQSSTRYDGVSPRSDLKTNSQFEDDPLLHWQPVQTNVTELVRCGHVACCPSEVALLHSGLTANAETSVCDTVKQRVAVIEPTGYKRLD